MDKSHKDLDTIDLSVPRLAQYMLKAWKKHQNMVYWVDINFALKKGLKFYRTKSNAVILCDTLPAYCVSKIFLMKSKDVIYQKENVSPQPPPTISYKDYWMCVLDSDVARGSSIRHPTNRTKTQYPTIKYRGTCYKMERRNPGTYQV